MRRLWLLFAQTATIGLAIWFIVNTLQPDWLQGRFTVRHTRLGATDIPLREAAPGTMAPNSYREVAKLAMPPVVNIFTTKDIKQTNPFTADPHVRKFLGDQGEEDDEKQPAVGSGVLISAQGYVITNFHIIDGASDIAVALTDGRKTHAKVVGSDPDTDLAVIKIDLPDLPVMTLAQPDQLAVGDVVLAIGNPFGVGQTVTMGIVSALGRNHLRINTFENFIQSDAAINPGNSGGALVDMNGNLVGINTAIYSRSGGSLGIGFTIPVSTVKTVMESIIATGHVVRGFIGVEPEDITPELASSFNLAQQTGAIMAGVVKDGPADKAGIKPGDILIAINGNKIADTTEMLNMVAQLPPDSTATLDLIRKTTPLRVKVRVIKRPASKHQEIPESKE